MKSKIQKEKYINFLEFFSINKWKSRAQLSQDLFVLYFSNLKKDGFFIEIGACDGVYYSNSLALEKYGWNGILSEPATIWHENLKKRKYIISKKAVYHKSGLKLEFDNAKKNPDLSGLKDHIDKDNNHNLRNEINTTEVETISLNDLIKENTIKKDIDYISIDTEGSEYEILKNFDFKTYKVEIFTIEHNFIEKKRKSIFDLMVKNDYVKIFSNISQWDDWYVKKDNKILLSLIE